MAKRHDVLFGGMKARFDLGGQEGGIFAQSGAIQTAMKKSFHFSCNNNCMVARQSWKLDVWRNC